MVAWRVGALEETLGAMLAEDRRAVVEMVVAVAMVGTTVATLAVEGAARAEACKVAEEPTAKEEETTEEAVATAVRGMELPVDSTEVAVTVVGSTAARAPVHRTQA